jgi:hypothetical protein
LAQRQSLASNPGHEKELKAKELVFLGIWVVTPRLIAENTLRIAFRQFAKSGTLK